MSLEVPPENPNEGPGDINNEIKRLLGAMPDDYFQDPEVAPLKIDPVRSVLNEMGPDYDDFFKNLRVTPPESETNEAVLDERMSVREAMEKLAKLHLLVLNAIYLESPDRKKAVPKDEKFPIADKYYPQEVVRIPGDGRMTALYTTNEVYTESGLRKVLHMQYAQFGKSNGTRLKSVGLDITIWPNGAFLGSMDSPDNSHINSQWTIISFNSKIPGARLSPDGERAIQITIDQLERYTNPKPK
jgi:hypothetical protein